MQTNKWMSKQASEWQVDMSKGADRQADKQMSKWTNKLMNEQMNEWAKKWVSEQEKVSEQTKKFRKDLVCLQVSNYKLIYNTTIL